MSLAILQLVGGLAVLTLGGHFIVKGSIHVALMLRVSTAIAGLTVVAFGTSLPELAVSLDAAAINAPDISYGNIIGSNIFNIAAILGIVALLRPVEIAPSAVRLQYPVMLAVMIACVAVSVNGVVSRFEGSLLVGGLVAFLAGTVHFAHKGRAAALAEQYEHEVAETGSITGSPLRQWTLSLLMVAGGILGLWKGADWMVEGAVTVAQTLGVSQRIIGLTVVAMGTSLPELAASVAASRHGDSKIVMGNLLGSNIFNVLAILGITSTVYSVAVNDRAIQLDNWVMLAFAVGLYPVMVVGAPRIGRRAGALLLAGFATYFGVLLIWG